MDLLCVLYIAQKRVKEFLNITRIYSEQWMVNLKKHRYDNVLYIGHGDEYFVCKVSRLLHRMHLFVYDTTHNTSEGQ